MAIGPAVPGLAPGACMEAGARACPCHVEPALQASGGGSQFGAAWPGRHKSPQRELGDCDAAHPPTLPCSSGVVYLEWQAGWRLGPQSPGSRPGLVWRQGLGLVPQQFGGHPFVRGRLDLSPAPLPEGTLAWQLPPACRLRGVPLTAGRASAEPPAAAPSPAEFSSSHTRSSGAASRL